MPTSWSATLDCAAQRAALGQGFRLALQWAACFDGAALSTRTPGASFGHAPMQASPGQFWPWLSECRAVHEPAWINDAMQLQGCMQQNPAALWARVT